MSRHNQKQGVFVMRGMYGDLTNSTRLTLLTFSLLLPAAASAQNPVMNPADISGQKIAVAAAGAPATAPQAASPAADNPRNIYVLILCDNVDSNGDGKLRDGFRNTAIQFRDMFARAFPVDAARPTKLILLPVGIDNQMTDNSVVTALSRIPTLTDDDAIVCTVNCHGGVSSPSPYVSSLGQQITQSPEYFFGHVLFTANRGEWFYRWNLWAALKGKKAGLTVLMTDSCFNFPQGVPVPQSAMSASVDPDYGATLRHLLRNYNGDVNLTASKPGTYAFYAGTQPSNFEGIFSMAFIGAARGSEIMNWAEIFTFVSESTSDGYRAVRARGSQADQVPHSFTDLNLSVKLR